MGTMMRRLVRLVVVAAVLTLLVHGMMAGSAEAAGRSLPQSTFNKNCKDSGGTVSEIRTEGTTSSQCTKVKDGTLVEVSCDFYGSVVWTCTGQTRPMSN